MKRVKYLTIVIILFTSCASINTYQKDIKRYQEAIKILNTGSTEPVSSSDLVKDQILYFGYHRDWLNNEVFFSDYITLTAQEGCPIYSIAEANIKDIIPNKYSSTLILQNGLVKIIYYDIDIDKELKKGDIVKRNQRIGFNGINLLDDDGFWGFRLQILYKDKPLDPKVFLPYFL